MIFLDRSIPRSVADSLKSVRSDVLWLEDRFPHNTPDEDWLPEAGREAWLVVVRDKKIRTRRWQRELLRDHLVGCFIIDQKRDPTRWEYYKLFGRCLDQMEEIDRAEQRPYLYLVNAAWSLRRFALG